MSATSEFSEASLIYLARYSESDWTYLMDLYEGAMALARVRYGTQEITIKTRSMARKQLIRQGLLKQYRKGKHFAVKLTEEGEAKAAEIPEEPPEAEAPPEVPEPPFRVGKDHILPGRAWKAILGRVKSGEFDIMIIPREQKTRTGYWDE